MRNKYLELLNIWVKVNQSMIAGIRVSDVVISPVSCCSGPGLPSFQFKTILYFKGNCLATFAVVLVVCFLLTDSRI